MPSIDDAKAGSRCGPQKVLVRRGDRIGFDVHRGCEMDGVVASESELLSQVSGRLGY